MTRSRIFPVLIKEFIHIRRDPRSLMILFAIPLFMMFIFGYAIDMDLKHIRIGICDLSRTSESRHLIERLDASNYFDIALYVDRPDRAELLFQKRLVRAVVIFPGDFAHKLASEHQAAIGVITDGSDANSATLVQNHLEALFMNHALVSASVEGRLPVDGRFRVLYNPDQSSPVFVVPGLVAILMIMIGALLTSITIAREKETGTLEQILVSPVRPHEIILGKAVPYLVLAVSVALLIIFFGMHWFDVPMAGSWPWLLFCVILYLFTAVAIGLFISSMVHTQQVAMMFAMMATMLPSIMLSGFIFPVASMPLPLRAVSNLIPATHFLIIIRGIMLKGNGPAELWLPVLAMLVLGIFFIMLAVRRFRLTLQ